ncbi:hypothetical protein BO71DRAFT_469332 [Aspergillus ellipticus CBS 707.79]|uniref:Uncharacterized protein n=1 Tax=Aspergillus ellipticus CBS 707.79 TaxID=1448320 RepID=A0A319EAG5_9EURO|nr:hypothetical protein BO71DRAFT_469332 [Aspergillus ellipticus CBS 707.79]
MQVPSSSPRKTTKFAQPEPLPDPILLLLRSRAGPATTSTTSTRLLRVAQRGPRLSGSQSTLEHLLEAHRVVHAHLAQEVVCHGQPELGHVCHVPQIAVEDFLVRPVLVGGFRIDCGRRRGWGCGRHGGSSCSSGLLSSVHMDVDVDVDVIGDGVSIGSA